MSGTVRVWQCFECGWFGTEQGRCECGRKIWSSVEMSHHQHAVMDMQKRVLGLDPDKPEELVELQKQIEKESAWLT